MAHKALDGSISFIRHLLHTQCLPGASQVMVSLERSKPFLDVLFQPLPGLFCQESFLPLYANQPCPSRCPLPCAPLREPQGCLGVLTCTGSLSCQEIPLSEILTVETARNFSLVPPGTNPHCFEIVTANATYFVGETPGGAPGGPSGQSAEAARGWETAIRQALMPVILQDAPSAPGHAPHSTPPPGPPGAWIWKGLAGPEDGGQWQGWERDFWTQG